MLAKFDPKKLLTVLTYRLVWAFETVATPPPNMTTNFSGVFFWRTPLCILISIKLNKPSPRNITVLCHFIVFVNIQDDSNTHSPFLHTNVTLLKFGLDSVSIDFSSFPINFIFTFQLSSNY